MLCSQKFLIILILLCFQIACTQKKSEEESSTESCVLPEGTTISSNQRYIEGPITVSLAGGGTAQFTLHVQRLVKTAAYTWGTDVVSTFSENGKTPCQAYEDIKVMWQDYYQDMIDAGIDSDVIQTYVNSLSNPRSESARDQAGVYAETYLSACGFAGSPGTIYCGVDATAGVQHYYVAHENTHGFQWESTRTDDSQNIILYRIFGKYANDFYNQSISDSSVFTPISGAWSVNTMDYALQNEAEWIADIFSGYLYGGTGHWSYIDGNFPKLKSFFDCFWKSGNTFSSCQSSTGVSMIDYPQKVPVVDIPIVSGFTQAESEAIWNICFNTSSSSSHLTAFNNLIERLTPGLYTNSSPYFELGYGDCNHDGYIDWICSYKGAAPGGGNYLWNTSNQIGAYTFIASGKSGDTYAEYKQDPYLTLPTINGSLAQPMYREWQGSFGSCNGASYFSAAPTRFPTFVQSISGLPSELTNKTDW